MPENECWVSIGPDLKRKVYKLPPENILSFVAAVVKKHGLEQSYEVRTTAKWAGRFSTEMPLEKVVDTVTRRGEIHEIVMPPFKDGGLKILVCSMGAGVGIRIDHDRRETIDELLKMWDGIAKVKCEIRRNG